MQQAIAERKKGRLVGRPFKFIFWSAISLLACVETLEFQRDRRPVDSYPRRRQTGPQGVDAVGIPLAFPVQFARTCG